MALYDLRQPRQVPRNALIAAAVGQGLQNTAATLFDLDKQRQKEEADQAELLQQWKVHQDSVDATKAQQAGLDAYRGELGKYRKDKLTSDTEHNRAMEGLQRDQLDITRQHNAAVEARDAAKAAIDAANPKPATTKGFSKPTETQQLIEDYGRVQRGLNPKFYKGATLPTLQKLIDKKTTITQPQMNPVNQIISDAMNSGGAQPPGPPANPTMPTGPLPPPGPSGRTTSGNSFVLPQPVVPNQ